MASFKDVDGKSWQVAFNIGVCNRVKSEAGLDFANAHDGKAVAAIQSDDMTMVQVLWLLCDKQAKERDIKEEDFAFLLNGEVLEEAQKAIEDALVLFTRPERRPAVIEIFAKKKEAITKAVELAVQKVRAMDVSKEIGKQLSLSTAGS